VKEILYRLLGTRILGALGLFLGHAELLCVAA
jgi:hypothetical protein